MSAGAESADVIGLVGARPTERRFVPRPWQVSLAAALWITALCNTSFWRSAARAVGGVSLSTLPFLASLFVVVALVIHLCLLILDWPVVGRFLIAIVMIASSIAAWFESTYGVLIDKTMLRNVMETDAREVGELLNPVLIAQAVLLGVIPAILLFRLAPGRRSLWKEAAAKIGWTLATLLAIVLVVTAFGRDYAGFLRNNRELRHALTPTNLFAAGWAYGRESAPDEVAPIGTDARLAPAARGHQRPALLVLVVGETARTANFSLAGYPRETNPELRDKSVVFYPHMFACGTSTATSLPCLFSALGRAGFSSSKAEGQEGLLDVVHHAGYPVLWRDNNSGCKGACDRVEFEDLSSLDVPGLCADGECRDEILLRGLQERLDETSGDLMVVLHQKGSHGPAYFRRYPPEMEVFRPACHTAELSRCTREEIANAYDNSIRYTDHVLAETIALLEQNAARFDVAMLYVSDHGESLGENGVYLHGLPYFIAPEAQTNVPMIAWMSGGFLERSGLDSGCLEASRTRRITHDGVFHSVLGLLDVETSVYRENLDIFQPCRSGVAGFAPLTARVDAAGTARTTAR